MKRIIIAILIVIFAVNLSGCNSNKLTDKSIRKILEQDNKFSETMNVSTITIKAMINLDDTGYNKFVLLHGKINTTNNDMYVPICINTQEKQTHSIYWEAPLSMIMKQVLLSEAEDTNIAIFNRMAECIKSHGTDYFSSEENAIKFINDITLNNSIIDVKTARNIIFEQFVASLETSSENVEVFFEKGTAIPKYITSKKLEKVENPNWNGVAGYSYMMDRDTIVTMERMFGPEYVMETVWETAKIGTPFERIGNFNSKEEIKNKFNVDDTKTISTHIIEEQSDSQNTKKYSPVESVDEKVQDIRAWYYYTQNNLSSYRVEQSKQEKRYYDNENSLVKLEVVNDTESEEYFFNKGNLYFVFCFNKNTENRFYFYNDVLFRWIDNNKVIHDNSFEDKQYIQWMEYLLSNKLQLLK